MTNTESPIDSAQDESQCLEAFNLFVVEKLGLSSLAGDKMSTFDLAWLAFRHGAKWQASRKESHPAPSQALPYEKQHPELRGLPPEQRGKISVHPAVLEDIIRGCFEFLGHENPVTCARVAMDAIRPYVNEPKPVSVKATAKRYDNEFDSLLHHHQKNLFSTIRAVLDEAGVAYVD